MSESFFAVAEDDITSMRVHLRLLDLPYVDFALEDERRAALERWPLLRDLYQFGPDRSIP